MLGLRRDWSVKCLTIVLAIEDELLLMSLRRGENGDGRGERDGVATIVGADSDERGAVGACLVGMSDRGSQRRGVVVKDPLERSRIDGEAAAVESEWRAVEEESVG